jgi:hypothetical protein
MQILGQSGFLPTHGVGVVNPREIPVGPNAEETEQYLRTRRRIEARPGHRFWGLVASTDSPN